jgi:hypothetical protein
MPHRADGDSRFETRLLLSFFAFPASTMLPIPAIINHNLYEDTPKAKNAQSGER